MSALIGPEIHHLVTQIAKLPGLGPRSARRAALHLIKHRDGLMKHLTKALTEVADKVQICDICGTYDSMNPCVICRSPTRDSSLICVVHEVSDLWAMERSGVYGGLYHVLGGSLSALDGIGPDDLSIGKLTGRALPGVEIILALSATVDGQTTAHYLLDILGQCEVKLTGLAHGVPVGGEVSALDDGTIAAALSSRHGF